MKQIPMTVRGADKLREELDYLKVFVALKLFLISLMHVNMAT